MDHPDRVRRAARGAPGLRSPAHGDGGVRVYAGTDPRLPLADVAEHARRVEAMGYDGLHVAETVHDALAVALLAAEHTERITIRTSVALAFVRSPTLVAYAAWDLSRFSGGRFELGLGTQIRQNVEERYGMPWGEPVARMRDHLGALDALFASFRTGEPPRHEGPWYRITRMQPYFNPGPDAATRTPPLWLGGVGRPLPRQFAHAPASSPTPRARTRATSRRSASRRSRPAWPVPAGPAPTSSSWSARPSSPGRPTPPSQQSATTSAACWRSSTRHPPTGRRSSLSLIHI